MGSVSVGTHHSVVLKLFWHKSEFCMMLIFETARLMELGSKTGYHILASLKCRATRLFILPAVSIPIKMLR